MGTFITLEGVQYTGKSVMLEAVFLLFQRAGAKVLTSREPGGTLEGEKLRRTIFQRRQEGAPSLELAELFYESRHLHLEKVLWPFLGRNKEKKGLLVSSRFCDSTLVLQGLEGGVPLDKLQELEREAVCGFYPDLTIIFFIPENTFYPILNARRSWKIERRVKSTDHNPWDKAQLAIILQRQRFYFTLPSYKNYWPVKRNFVFLDASRHPLVVLGNLAEIIFNVLLKKKDLECLETRSFGDLSKLIHDLSQEELWQRLEEDWQAQERLRKEFTLPPK